MIAINEARAVGRSRGAMIGKYMVLIENTWWRVAEIQGTVPAAEAHRWVRDAAVGRAKVLWDGYRTIFGYWGPGEP